MSSEIPAHLNPHNDPERARQLREAQKAMLETNAVMVASIEEGKTLFPDRADWDDFLARLGRVRQQILDWEADAGEMENFMLHFKRMFGEAEARYARSTSIVMQKIVNAPEAKLEILTEQERVQHFEMTKDWEELKDTFLGILPIEERKRIEGE